MKSIETSGKTVEDAVKVGLAELKCDSADVNIDVLEMGSPGLFGMFGKLARVRLTVKEEDVGFEMPVMSLETHNPRPAKPQAEKRQPEKRQSPAPEKAAKKQSDAPKAPPARKQEPKAKAASEDPKPQKPMDASEPIIKSVEEFKASRQQREPRRRQEAPRIVPAPAEQLPPLDLSALSETGQRAHHFLLNVTKLMGVEVDIRMKEEEGHLFVQMNGDALGVLIGRRGETLDALQYLTSLHVNKGRDTYTRVSLDSEHYRAKREDALRKLASRMAARARKTGHRVALEPMNPYERRVLHSALQDNPYVTTHSEGDEPYRRVIISLK